MTKTEIKVICLQVAGNEKPETIDYSRNSQITIDRAQKFFDWITEGVEFCPHCGEEGVCDNEENESGLYN